VANGLGVQLTLARLGAEAGELALEGLLLEFTHEMTTLVDNALSVVQLSSNNGGTGLHPATRSSACICWNLLVICTPYRMGKVLHFRFETALQKNPLLLHKHHIQVYTYIYI
jgi:hypothetical protein